MNTTGEYDFRKVSPTALIPAFARGAYTDIPWAGEMLAVLRGRGATLNEGAWSEEGAREYASLFDARFRAVSRLIEEKGARQVLELAGGLSPRGMEFARRGIVYVEADLEESTVQKRELVTAILGSVPAELHLCEANVLDRGQFLACCAPFSMGRPVAVTTEGLLRYLTFEEKTRLAANVHVLLERYGGWWITPDIHLWQFVERHSAAHRQREHDTLGRSLDANYFVDLEHAQEFFEDGGFLVESRPLLEGIREQIGVVKNEVLMAELNERRVFVMTARN